MKKLLPVSLWVSLLAGFLLFLPQSGHSQLIVSQVFPNPACRGDSVTIVGNFPGGTGVEADTAVIGAFYLSASNDTIRFEIANTVECGDSMLIALDRGVQRDTIRVFINSGDASFTYPATVCNTSPSVLPSAVTTGGGTFSSQGGIVVFGNTGTGEINLGATPTGTHRIYYTLPGACGTCGRDSFDITINNADDGSFTYATPVCDSTGGGLTPSIVLSGGTFSEPGGNITFFNTTTGVIDRNNSNAGVHRIYYNTSGAGGSVCPVIDSFDITITARPDPLFTFPAGPFCKTDPNPSPLSITTAGGTFFDTTGVVSVNATTGELSIQFSPPGMWNILHRVGTTCPDTFSVNVEITAQEDPLFSYGGTTFCKSGGNPTPTPNTSGGTYSDTTGGLVFVGSNGEIDLVNTPSGTYVIRYITPGTCSDTGFVTVNITATVNPFFSYPQSNYCHRAIDPVPDSVTVAGGLFDDPMGMVNFVDPNTGQIDINTTPPGTYTIRYTSSGCAADSQVTITIDPADTAFFSYSKPLFCVTEPNPLPDSVTQATGSYFDTTGAVIFANAATGEINLALTPPDTYNIFHGTATTICQDTAFFQVIVSALEDPYIHYPDTNLCLYGINMLPDSIATPGGNFSVSSGVGLQFSNLPAGEIDGALSTPGPYTIKYETIGTCPDSSFFNLNVVSLDNPSFQYASATFCESDTNPRAIVLGDPGGTFTDPGGAFIIADPNTGLINISGSPKDTLVFISYTTNLTCPNSTTFGVTIRSSDDPTFVFPKQTYCRNEPNPSAIINYPGGSFISIPSGVVFADSMNGIVDLAASNNGAYLIQYRTPGPCVDSTTVLFDIVTQEDPTFGFADTIYCAGGADPIPTISGTGGGIFRTVTPGLVLLDDSTGLIDLDSSATGAHTLRYTTPGACPDSTTFDIFIVPQDTTFIDYDVNNTVALYCPTSPNPTPTITGSPGGRFFELTGNVVFANDTTGEINIAASTPGGPYIIYYNSPDSCSFLDFTLIQILPPEDATFFYADSVLCQGEANPTPTILGDGGGTFFSNTGNVRFVNTITGQILLDSSFIGTWDIFYRTPGACPDTATARISIQPQGDARFVYDAPEYCINDSNVKALVIGDNNGQFTADPPTLFFISDSSGLINFQTSVADTYQIKYSVPGPAGGCPDSSVVTVILTPEDNSTIFFYDKQVYCKTDPDPVPTVFGTAGGFFTYTAQSGGPNLSINTSSGAINLASSDPGEYRIRYDIPGVCSSDTAFVFTVVEKDDPNFIYDDDAYCQSEADPIPTIIGDSGGFFKELTGNLAFLNNFSGIIDLDQSVPGPYIVTYVTAGLCPDSLDFRLRVDAVPAPLGLGITPDTIICFGTNVTITANGPLDAAYEFRRNGIPDQDSVVGREYTNAGLQNRDRISMIATNIAGCQDSVATSFLVNKIPVMNIIESDSIISGGDEIRIEVGTNADSTIFSYSMVSDGPVAPPFSFDETPPIDSGMTFPIQEFLTLTNDVSPAQVTYTITPIGKGNCIGETDTVIIAINPNNEDIFIPGFFTPNGDNFNDYWRIQIKTGIPTDQIAIRVFNRAGGLVAELDYTDIESQWMAPGLPDGVYWYILEDGNSGITRKSGLTIRRK